MLEHVCKHWWVLLVRGLAAILFGVLTFAWPGITLLVLILFYAAHALVDGIAAMVLGFQMRKATGGAPWGAMVLVGIVSIIAGIVAFAWPGITALALLYVVAFWAIARGVFEIMAAIRLRKEIDNEWLLGLAGLASIVFGVLLIARPGAGILALLWLVGSFAIAFGILEIVLAFRLKGLRNRISSRAAPAPAA